MGIQDIIEGKKQGRAHTARVKALPPDYRIVYKEMQKYFFKVGPIELSDGTLLSEIVDFFEEGVAAGKGVLELIGTDVAAFCDDLIKDAHLRGASIRNPSAGNPARPRSKTDGSRALEAARPDASPVRPPPGGLRSGGPCTRGRRRVWPVR